MNNLILTIISVMIILSGLILSYQGYWTVVSMMISFAGAFGLIISLVLSESTVNSKSPPS